MNQPPSIFTLETVLGCNLRCPECAVGGGYVNRKYGLMSLEQYLILADKIRPYAQYLYLHLWGEPMLNKDIFSMLRHAREYARTNISTNANLMDKRMAKDLIDSGVSEIIVSIDGVTQATYEAYRRRGQVGKALRGLALLAHYNAKRAHPASIIPQFIVFAHNEHEMEAFTAFCAEIGLKPTFKAPYVRQGSSLRPSELPGLSRHVARTPATRSQAMRQCQSARTVLTVLLDGTAVACCYDHNGVTAFGNLYTQGLEEIWESEAYQTFRRQVAEGNPSLFCLEECLLY